MYASMGVTINDAWKAGPATCVKPRDAGHRQLLLPDCYRCDLTVGNTDLAGGMDCGSVARNDGRVGDDQIQFSAPSRWC